MLVTALDLLFADGEYVFDLKLPQLAELQEKCGGVFEVHGRLLSGRYVVDGCTIEQARDAYRHLPNVEIDQLDGGLIVAIDWSAARATHADIFETIRLGLIGGGLGIVDGVEIEVTSLTAKALVERYCHPLPLKQSWSIAASVAGARLKGYEPKKKEPVSEQAPAKPPRKKSTSKRSAAAAS